MRQKIVRIFILSLLFGMAIILLVGLFVEKRGGWQPVIEILKDSSPSFLITHLDALPQSHNTIRMSWIKPKAFKSRKKTLHYIIKHSLSPITESNWDKIPDKATVHTYWESTSINNLFCSKKYYFGIKVTDLGKTQSKKADRLYTVSGSTKRCPVNPVIFSVLPLSGGTGSSQNLTIKGKNFEDRVKVRLLKDNKVTRPHNRKNNSFVNLEILKNDSRTITALIPADLPPGQYQLEVRNTGGEVTALKEKYTIYDTSPPSAITGLELFETTRYAITLSWPAPFDHPLKKQISTYDLRHSLTPLSEKNWDTGKQSNFEPGPAAPNHIQRMTISKLDCNKTYWFAIKSMDEKHNISHLSNVLAAKTSSCPAPPLLHQSILLPARKVHRRQ